MQIVIDMALCSGFSRDRASRRFTPSRMNAPTTPRSGVDAGDTTRPLCGSALVFPQVIANFAFNMTMAIEARTMSAVTSTALSRSVTMLVLFVALLCGTPCATAAETAVHEGELNGAPYKVAVPADWQGGRAFFHVHGWRPDTAPHLADLDLSDPFYQALQAAGWLIGRTAFRENGVDHDAHTIALAELKDWIEAEIGPIELLVMEGESTAGTLVLRIAERHPELADGVIAKGAYIELDDSSVDAYLEARPLRPALLMSNLTELDGPIAYAARAATAEVAPGLRPLLRPGHVNVNWAERLAALEAVQAWIEDGLYAAISDGTRQVPERATGTESGADGLVNRVTAIDPFYGNATLGFHPDELAAAGIHQGASFILEAHGAEHSIHYGQAYGDVPQGEWIAFRRADDQILLARNHARAIDTAGLEPGDRVLIRPAD